MTGRRRRIFWPAALAVSALLMAASARAEPAVSESTVIRSVTFKSMALGRPLQFSLYLPPGYDADDETRRYPSIYLLHGHGGTDVSWLDSGALRETADRLIAEGALPPSIIVMPFAQTGWYVDSSGPDGAGRWQTAILDDLITYIDARYPTITDGAGRAIGGLSMGGYGALRFALMEPDEFAAAASLSGALFADVKNASEFPPFQINLFGRAFGKTFDPATFNAASPWRSIVDDGGEPDEVPALYMNVGDKDIPILAAGNVQFVAALKAAKIPVTYSVSPGGHNWGLWKEQTPPMLAFLGARLKRGTTVAQRAPIPDETRVGARLSTPETLSTGVKQAAPPALPPAAPKPVVVRP